MAEHDEKPAAGHAPPNGEIGSKRPFDDGESVPAPTLPPTLPPALPPTLPSAPVRPATPGLSDSTPRLPDSPGAPGEIPIARRPIDLPPVDRTAPPAKRGSGAFWVAIALVAAAIGGVGYWAYRTQEPDLSAAETEADPSGDPAGRDAVVSDHPAETAPPATTSPTVVAAPTVLLPIALPGANLPPWTTETENRLSVFRYVAAYYEDSRLDAPFVEYHIEYAVASDDVTVAATDESGAQLRRDYFVGDWVHRRSGDDPHDDRPHHDRAVTRYERTPRGADSLDPAPDHRLARRLTQVDVVPNAASPFTTVIDTVDQELYGTAHKLYLVGLDSVGFANAHPGDFAAWLERWQANDDLAVTGDTAGRQVADMPPLHHRSSVENPNMIALRAIADAVVRSDSATIVMALRPDATVGAAIIHDPAHDLFTIYLLSSNALYQTLSIPDLESLTDATWTDASS